MRFFKSPLLTPEQIERLDRTLAKGRRRYILLTGVLGCGMSCFILNTVWQWHDNFGWHFPPGQKACLFILFRLLLWSAGGYFFGTLMWKRLLDTRCMQSDGRDQMP